MLENEGPTPEETHEEPELPEPPPLPKPPRGRKRFSPEWAKLPDEKLLDLRLCDLGVRISGTLLEQRIKRIHEELAARNLIFRPHFWLSTEWFTPDGVPGIAIPFYLAHPRLMQLEERQMLEVEGGSYKWCMQILRHEVGHAIDNAYRLHLKKSWRQEFGKASERYPEYYQPRPYSKRFVLHLDSWYAQSHPAEDFAETFAVWLTPGGQWRKRYKGWAALRKLEYVDQLMVQIAGREPPVKSRSRMDELRHVRTTLRQHYEEKRELYTTQYPGFYDRDLRRLFSDAPEHANAELAYQFLRRVRSEIRRLVARWTGVYQYTIDQVLEEMIDRARELKLRMDRVEAEARMETAVLVAVQTMNFLHSGHHRLAL